MYSIHVCSGGEESRPAAPKITEIKNSPRESVRPTDR